jgi:hypothetical protein
MDINSILEKHGKWLSHESGGECADFSGFDLHGINFYGINLREAVFCRTILSGVNFYGANLHGANFRGANFHQADLTHANFMGANLIGANLSKTGTHKASFDGAKGVISFGPVGNAGRIGLAWTWDGEPIIRLGCHEGGLDEMRLAIYNKYGENSPYERLVRAAVDVLMSTMED